MSTAKRILANPSLIMPVGKACHRLPSNGNPCPREAEIVHVAKFQQEINPGNWTVFRDSTGSHHAKQTPNPLSKILIPGFNFNVLFCNIKWSQVNDQVILYSSNPCA
jgi:hypothetical protein